MNDKRRNIKHISTIPDKVCNQGISGLKLDDCKSLVYICCPVAEDMEEVKRYGWFAVTQGCIPIAPHLNFAQVFDACDREESKLIDRFGKILMQKCSEVWVFGDVDNEKTAREIALAERLNLPIRYFSDLCEEAGK